jgi:acyl carrier protein
MEKSQLFEDVKRIMGEFAEIDVSHLTKESRIATSFPNLDSLQMYEMLVYLEEALDFEVDENVIDKFETLDDLTTYIYEKKQSKIP